MFVDQVERQQRMPEVVEHAHEQYDVEAFAERPDVVDREPTELDRPARYLAAKRACAR